MATPALHHDIRIEPATADDIDSAMRVMNSAFGERFGEAWTRSQLNGILPMPGVAMTIAVDPAHSAVVGFSLTRTIAGESELLLIGVLPEIQRRGVGTRLLDHFIDEARQAGVARVHLEVRDGNPAIGMYRAAGFNAVGRRRNYYRAADGNRYDAITLACEL
jgi:ribosomal-protein-alanine N-acetyltransferase